MGDGQPRLLDEVRDQDSGENITASRRSQAYVDLIRGFVLCHNKSGSLTAFWQMSAAMAVVSLGFGFASSRPRPVRR
jgi:hypothetical protein